MAFFRRVSPETRAEALKKCLKVENVAQVAKEFGFSESTLRRDYKLILDNTEAVISMGTIEKIKKKLHKLWLRLFRRQKEN